MRLDMKITMIKKSILSLGLIVCPMITSHAQQDKQFSMFQHTKSQVNPAAAGFFEGDYQLFTNFRNQWMSVSDNPFRTISAAFDTRFKAGNGLIGTGINFYNDLSGDALYSVNQITIPVNYAVTLSEFSELSFGISPSFYQRSIKNSNTTWDNQWTGVAFNPTISNNEGIPAGNVTVGKFDIGAGLHYQRELSKLSWFSVGISADHLTKQKISFFSDENGLYRKLTAVAHGNFSRKHSNFTLKPNAMMFIQGPNKMFILGSGFDFLLKGKSLHTAFHKRTSIEFGSYIRVGDAFVLNTIFHMSGLGIGASVDINTSSLNNGSGGFGAMEFFLSYKFGKPRGLGSPSIQ
jgi:type IX secretion system PorP/SprF family membrane protein